MKYQNILKGAVAAAMVSGTANAAILANWTFETSIPATAGPHAAELGVYASTSFASSNTSGTFSNPAGNGTAESFSSNGWESGEYFEFSTSSEGYTEGIVISFDHMGSNTGPKDFILQYSTNGVNFTTFGSAYTVINASWSAGTAVTTSSYSFDLSGVTALSDNVTIAFRLVDNSAVAINGSAVAAAGTSRVDNVVISTVPEPASMMLGAIGVLGLLRRRR